MFDLKTMTIGTVGSTTMCIDPVQQNRNRIAVNREGYWGENLSGMFEDQQKRISWRLQGYKYRTNPLRSILYKSTTDSPPLFFLSTLQKLYSYS